MKSKKTQHSTTRARKTQSRERSTKRATRVAAPSVNRASTRAKRSNRTALKSETSLRIRSAYFSSDLGDARIQRAVRAVVGN